MIKEGIYLEEKTTTVGVSGTAKPIQFKNMWATREITDNEVVLQLLDDKAKPTGLVERVKPGALARRFVYKPVKPEIWTAIKKQCLAIPVEGAATLSSPKKKTSAKKGNAAVKPKNWWDL